MSSISESAEATAEASARSARSNGDEQHTLQPDTLATTNVPPVATLMSIAEQNRGHLVPWNPRPGPNRFFRVLKEGSNGRLLETDIHWGRGLTVNDVVGYYVELLEDPERGVGGIPETLDIHDGETLVARISDPSDGSFKVNVERFDTSKPPLQLLPVAPMRADELTADERHVLLGNPPVPPPDTAEGDPCRWRYFRVDQEDAGFPTLVEGPGATLEQAIDTAREEIREAVAEGLKPADMVIIEEDRIVARVLVKDVLGTDAAPAPAPGSPPTDASDDFFSDVCLLRCVIDSAAETFRGAKGDAELARHRAPGSLLAKLADARLEQARTHLAIAVLATTYTVGAVEEIASGARDWEPTGAKTPQHHVHVAPGVRDDGADDYSLASAEVSVLGSDAVEDLDPRQTIAIAQATLDARSRRG